MQDSTFLVEQIAEATDRIARGVSQLTDRQRVSARATNVFFHGTVPLSATYVYFVSASSTGSIADIRLQNLENREVSVSLFLVDWKQVSKQDTSPESPNLGSPVTIETSDLSQRYIIPAGGRIGEAVDIAVPSLWIIALRATGAVNGHISGIEILTV